MKTDELDYHLPPELIAQQPSDIRSKSRLLVLRRGHALIDTYFERIGEFFRPSDCFVLNDTKVVPARFFAQRASGAKIEGLFIREAAPGAWETLLKNAGRLKAGETINLLDHNRQVFCSIQAQETGTEGMWRLKVNHPADAYHILGQVGIMPLPPYIKRKDVGQEIVSADRERYQTVYARHAGAVAAPTAGLHFTDELMAQLKQEGIKFAHLTLHVGLGTFKPVTADTLDNHQIHSEIYHLDDRNAAIINDAKATGGRIIAVGTTSVRTLETIAHSGKVAPQSGATQLFIKPGYQFKIVDGMITNFHLPRSTLLALVGAFAGLENIMAAYRHAVEQRYRFYSYGDAMLII
jgi:S-adenosylmethionine:tRNA ribosyltransferase-isomerase